MAPEHGLAGSRHRSRNAGHRAMTSAPHVMWFRSNCSTAREDRQVAIGTDIMRVIPGSAGTKLIGVILSTVIHDEQVKE